MSNELKVMKIGSGKKTAEDGTVERVPGYAPRAGKSLSELLKEYKTVEITAMGGEAVNNMVKAIVHATELLGADGKTLTVSEFVFKHDKLIRRDGNAIEGVLVSAKVTLQ